MKTKTSFSKFICIRIAKEKFIWIFVPISLILIFFCNFFTIIPLPFSEKTVDKINDIVLALSYSYLAGMIVYFLTIFLPSTRKVKFVLADFVEDLGEIKYEFSEFSRKFISDDFSANETIDLIFRAIAKKDYEQISITENFEIPNEITKFYIQLYAPLSAVMEKYEIYFDDEDYKRLSQLRQSFVFNEVKKSIKDTIPLAYNKKTLKECFIPTMISNYKEIESLYNDFSSVYGYDYQ